MSKTISELNPTLSPSALPEITMRDGWSLGEESDSDVELTSPGDPGLISPAGTNSNVSLKHLGCLFWNFCLTKGTRVCLEMKKSNA